MSDAAMLDSLSLQLREAESRRAEAERAHQVSFRLSFSSTRDLPSKNIMRIMIIINRIMTNIIFQIEFL
jgi:hypothetical protein